MRRALDGPNALLGIRVAASGGNVRIVTAIESRVDLARNGVYLISKKKV